MIIVRAACRHDYTNRAARCASMDGSVPGNSPSTTTIIFVVEYSPRPFNAMHDNGCWKISECS